MDSYLIAQIIALALAVAVLVILIVVLTRNKLSDVPQDQQFAKLDNKINWLYGLEIASVGVMVLFGLISIFGWMRWSSPCA